jgi:hypothetical protein
VKFDVDQPPITRMERMDGGSLGLIRQIGDGMWLKNPRFGKA